MAESYKNPTDRFTDEFLAGTLTKETVFACLFPRPPMEPPITVTHENGFQITIPLSAAIEDIYLRTEMEQGDIAKALCRGDELFADCCVYQLEKARA